MITKLSGSVRPLFCLPLQPVDLENSPHQQQGASPFFEAFQNAGSRGCFWFACSLRWFA
jgi:hypothetical protein